MRKDPLCSHCCPFVLTSNVTRIRAFCHIGQHARARDRLALTVSAHRLIVADIVRLTHGEPLTVSVWQADLAGAPSDVTSIAALV